MELLAYDYAKLDGRITEKLGTRKRYAEALGRSEKTVSLKMNNKIPFDQEEIDKSLIILDIPTSQIGEYFFRRKVQND